MINFDDLIPPKDEEILTNNRGAVVMNINTLLQILKNKQAANLHSQLEQAWEIIKRDKERAEQDETVR